MCYTKSFCKNAPVQGVIQNKFRKIAYMWIIHPERARALALLMWFNSDSLTAIAEWKTAPHRNSCHRHHILPARQFDKYFHLTAR